jgi:hypothetical protein
MAGSTERTTTTVISGLNFARPDPATPGAFVVDLPSDAEYANLRVGAVYYDSATEVLKIKV